jgi:hypothetical protein
MTLASKPGDIRFELLSTRSFCCVPLPYTGTASPWPLSSRLSSWLMDTLSLLARHSVVTADEKTAVLR